MEKIGREKEAGHLGTNPKPIYGVEAISLVTKLSRDQWILSGKPLPTYTRENIPVRFISFEEADRLDALDENCS